MNKFKKSEEYYLTQSLNVKSDNKGAFLTFDAGTSLEYSSQSKSTGSYIFKTRNFPVSITLTMDIVDLYISKFDEDAVRKANA